MRKTDDHQPRVILPYVNNLSNKMKRIYAKAGVRVSFKPSPPLRNTLMRKKPDALERRGLVYRIPCKDCNWSYVGETSRSLQDRLKEHKRAVRNFSTSSEIANHVLDNDHRIDWDNAGILDRESCHFKRLFKEAWHSKVCNSGNRVFFDLDNAWCPLV